MAFIQRPTRTDANQVAIMNYLRVRLYKVWDNHKSGNGVPDLIVLSKSDTPVFVLLEVKAENGGLTGKEIEFHHQTIGAPRHVVRTGAEAEQVMKIYDDMELRGKRA